MATSTEPEENIIYRTMDDLPGSYGWPIIGQSLKFVTDPIAMLAADVAVAVKEGMKLTKSNLFGRKMIMVSDPELVDFLLKKENKLLKSHWFEHHVPLFGEESIFVVTHERHTLFRRLFDKAFQPNAMDLCFPTIVSSMQTYLSDWSVNGVTDMLGETKRMTFGLAMDLLVGRGRFNAEEMQELRCCFDTFLQGFASFIPYRLPGTQYKRSLEAKETLMKKLREVVTLVMEEDEIGITNDEIGRGSLTKILVSEFNNDVGETMNVEQISQNLVMLLFAGGDTSSAVMVLLLVILQNRPDVLAKLVEEQRAFVEMHGEAYTREQVLKDMLYTGAVLHETYCAYCQSWLLHCGSLCKTLSYPEPT